MGAAAVPLAPPNAGAVKLPEPIPAAIRQLRRDARGYPVPWFVDLRAAYVNGCPDFRVMDGRRWIIAVKERRCWVCGERRVGPLDTFVAGPMCGVNRTTAEPAVHVECGRWSAKACPFLANPKRLRDERGLPGDWRVAGEMIPRNPGVTMLWTTMSAEVVQVSNGRLFDLGTPVAVEWWAKGRQATRAEVQASLDSGLPLLRAAAEREGREALAELGRRWVAFESWLPVDVVL